MDEVNEKQDSAAVNKSKIEYSIDHICKDDEDDIVDHQYCQAEEPNRNSENGKRQPLENINVNSVNCFDQNENIRNGERSNNSRNLTPE